MPFAGSAKPTRSFPRVLAFTALACLSLCAAAGVENPADTAEVRAVKLDMDLVRRVAAATRELQKLPPSRTTRAGTETGAAPTMEGEPVAKLVSQINASPQARAILASQRLGAHEYALAVYAVLNCSILAVTTPPGTTPTADRLERASVTAANASFCQAHVAELKKLMES